MAVKKILRIFLIFTIAQQICCTESLNNNANSQDLCLQKTKYKHLEQTETDSSLTPSLQLLKYTFSNLRELTIKYVKRAKNISEALLKDEELLNSKSTKVLEFKQNLTQFEEKYKLCDNLTQLFDLLDLYTSTTSSYYELEQVSFTDDSKLILSLLRKYGSEDLDKEFDQLVDVFMENIGKKMTELKEDLIKEQSKLSKLILEWYEDFKTLEEFDDKVASLDELFKFYKQE